MTHTDILYVEFQQPTAMHPTFGNRPRRCANKSDTEIKVFIKDKFSDSQFHLPAAEGTCNPSINQTCRLAFHLDG